MAATVETPKTNKKKTKIRKFRICAKGYFLTFPQCSVPKEDVGLRLTEEFQDDLQWAIICQELHQDGEKHLHIAFTLKNVMDTIDRNRFDFLTGQHGNYQGMKNPLRSIAYCRKSDKEPLIIGTLPETSSRKGVTNSVADMIMNGDPLRSVNAAFNGFTMMNLAKTMKYQQWVKNEKEKTTKLLWKDPVVPAGLDLEELQIIQWLRKNIRKDRPFKQAQLVIEGPANHNKSTLITELDRYLMIMMMPILEDFFDQWEDQEFDLVVFDEWTYEQHNPQYLNSFMDGSKMNVKVKGSQKQKTQNVPIIFNTNLSQEENFQKASPTMKSTFLARVTWVRLQRPIRIPLIISSLTGIPFQPPPPPPQMMDTALSTPALIGGPPKSPPSGMTIPTILNWDSDEDEMGDGGGDGFLF